MKRFLHATIGIALCASFMSCSKADAPELDSEKGINIGIAYGDSIETKAFITFSCQGDFTLQTKAMTRALTADGKDMTDLWVLDYKDGALAQAAIHQTAEDADFGSPTVPLSLGQHHLYFIASRSQSPTLNTDNHTLSFSKVLDTFYLDYTINVTSATTGAQAVTLNRCVTKLRIVINDAIPTDAATFAITPSMWQYSLDYLTGQPISATASQPITVNIPTSSIGKTGESVNIFGMSGSTEWTTDVTVTCKDVNDGVIGSATITNAPFKANRVTEYSGKLFSGASGFSASLLSAWDDDYIGSW